MNYKEFVEEVLAEVKGDNFHICLTAEYVYHKYNTARADPLWHCHCSRLQAEVDAIIRTIAVRKLGTVTIDGLFSLGGAYIGPNKERYEELLKPPRSLVDSHAARIALLEFIISRIPQEN